MKRKTLYPVVHKNKTRVWLKAWENYLMHSHSTARPFVKKRAALMRHGGAIVQFRSERNGTVVIPSGQKPLLTQGS